MTPPLLELHHLMWGRLSVLCVTGNGGEAACVPASNQGVVLLQTGTTARHVSAAWSVFVPALLGLK